MLGIKKDDQVVVIAGKDKGKTGRVLEILPGKQRAVVENINLVKKTQRRTQQNQKGGIIDIEASIHLSNLMLIDKKTNKPTRIGAEILKDGTKIRIGKQSGEAV